MDRPEATLEHVRLEVLDIACLRCGVVDRHVGVGAVDRFEGEHLFCRRSP